MKIGIFEADKALAMLGLWLVFPSGVGIAIAMMSPHGMAAFAYVSFVLGITGGLLHVAAYGIQTHVRRSQVSRLVSFELGLLSGAVTFPVSTFVFERALYLPSDPYQMSLVAYLLVVGSMTGWLITRISNKESA